MWILVYETYLKELVIYLKRPNNMTNNYATH